MKCKTVIIITLLLKRTNFPKGRSLKLRSRQLTRIFEAYHVSRVQYYEESCLTNLYCCVCFRSNVQGTQVNPRSMQQALSRALRRNASFSRGTDRYSRRDECPQYGVPSRIHVPWRGPRVPGIPQLFPQSSRMPSSMRLISSLLK